MTSKLTLGVLHPGAMGSSVAAAARAGTARVLFASQDRSPATLERARRDDLADVETLDRLLGESDVVVSVCPPAAAEALAQVVAKRGFGGVYVDANAISPDTSRRIGRTVEEAGARFVDGGIIGPPARSPGTTRLYLSGSQAERVASCFANGPLDAVVLEGPPGAASALKMAFAAYTKGTSALIAAIWALACREGVEEALRREWQLLIPELAKTSDLRVAGTAPKAWRFVGEMEQIASTLEASGLPGGFHRAAADVYRRLAEYKDVKDLPSAREVAERLLPG